MDFEVSKRVEVPEVLIVAVVSDFFEVLHMAADEQVPQRNEITVLDRIHLHNTPRIFPRPDLQERTSLI